MQVHCNGIVRSPYAHFFMRLSEEEVKKKEKRGRRREKRGEMVLKNKERYM